MARSKKASVGFIFITILIDVIGIGIIIPVLPSLIQSLEGGTLGEAALIGGWLISTYALMQFLCAPALGALSDRYGRRTVLLIALVGLSLDYLVHAVAPTLAWLFVSRLVAGTMGASFTVATAYISDVSTTENKARNFGMIGAAFGLGFILGPAIGGIFGKIDVRLPFYIAAGLTALNFLYGLIVLPESLPKEERRKIELKALIPGLSLFYLFKKKSILILVSSFFLIYIASYALQSTWAFYTAYRFNWDEAQVGYSLMAVGLMVAIVQGVFLGKIVKWLGTKKTLIVGFTLWFFGMLGYGLASTPLILYLVMIPYMLGGIASPTVQSVISNQVVRNEQGALQGALTSLISVTAIIGPFVMNSIFHYYTEVSEVKIPGASYFAAAGLIGISAIMIFLYVRGMSDEDFVSKELSDTAQPAVELAEDV